MLRAWWSRQGSLKEVRLARWRWRAFLLFAGLPYRVCASADLRDRGAVRSRVGGPCAARYQRVFQLGDVGNRRAEIVGYGIVHRDVPVCAGAGIALDDDADYRNRVARRNMFGNAADHMTAGIEHQLLVFRERHGIAQAIELNCYGLLFGRARAYHEKQKRSD